MALSIHPFSDTIIPGEKNEYFRIAKGALPIRAKASGKPFMPNNRHSHGNRRRDRIGGGPGRTKKYFQTDLRKAIGDIHQR